MLLKKGRSVLNGVLSDRLLRSSFWFFIAVLSSGLANYGLQVVLGRSLSTTEYGFYNVLLGVFVIFGVPVTTLQMVISRKTAEYQASGNFSSVRALFGRISKSILLFGGIGFIIYAGASRPLADFVRSASLVPIFILGLCVFVAVMMPVPLAVLQGLQESSWFAFLQGMNGPARFLFCGVAVVLGWGVNGALIGLLLSHVVIWAAAYVLVQKRVGAGALATAAEHEPLAWRDTIPVLAANFALVLITQMDLVLANRYFQPLDASHYASAAVLGRSIVYLPGALVLAMFPMVSESKARNVNTQPLLFKSLSTTLLLSGFGTILFFFWPHEILGLFFGPRYDASAEILKYYGVAMLPLAMVMVLTHYFIARGNAAFGFIMMAGALIEMGAIILFHSTILTVVSIAGGISTLLLLIGVILSFVDRTVPLEETVEYASSLGA